MTSPKAPALGGLNLEFLSEPTLILSADGGVCGANAAARELFGSCILNRNLFDFVMEGSEKARKFLRLAGGSTSPRVGAISLGTCEAFQKFRVHAARMKAGRSNDRSVILRLMSNNDDQFTVLNRRIRELDAHMHERLRENAALQEALSENKILIRELQHRVKNNVQQMHSLIRMSAAGCTSPEVAEVIRVASHRLRAMAMTQQAIYQTDRAAALSAKSFLGDIVNATAESYGASARITTSIDDLWMAPQEANCLALIANELVTNACKYGLAEGGQISVDFYSVDEALCLQVRDSGPGFDEEKVMRTSGLRLVRGLCRQIGGRLAIENLGGARCTVDFHSRLTADND